MRTHEAKGLTPVPFDVCAVCTSVWFDEGELVALGKLMRAHRQATPRPRGESALEAARRELDAVEAMQETEDDRGPPREGTRWWLFALATSLPVEGYNPVYRRPLITWALIVACTAVGLLEMGGVVGFEWALVPATLVDGHVSGWRGLFGSMFLHLDAVHLLGNMYFLKIFGDNVEDRLGRVPFLLFYVVCGLLSAVAYVLPDPGSVTPAVGASGAIAGVLAAYMVFFPHARVGVLVVFYWVKVRALWYLPYWFLWNVLAALVLHAPGVAWWAHIGGFVAGGLLAVALGRLLPDARLRAIVDRPMRLR